MKKLFGYLFILIGGLLFLLIFFVKGSIDLELFERVLSIPFKLICGIAGIGLLLMGSKMRK